MPKWLMTGISDHKLRNKTQKATFKRKGLYFETMTDEKLDGSLYVTIFRLFHMDMSLCT